MDMPKIDFLHIILAGVAVYFWNKSRNPYS